MAKRLKAWMLWLGFGQYRWFRRWYGGHWYTFIGPCWFPSTHCLATARMKEYFDVTKYGYRCEHWGE